MTFWSQLPLRAVAACHSLDPWKASSLKSWENEMLADLGQMKKACVNYSSSPLITHFISPNFR